MSGRRGGGAVLLAGLLAAVLAACAGNRPEPAAPAPGAVDRAASLEANRMGTLNPGDAVRVTVFQEPDLTGDFTVDQNGVVVFPLLGERNVRGVSADSLERELTQDYRRFLETPSINVTVLRRISILGSVRQPGLYPVDLTMSMNEALALAGGVSPDGDMSDIRLVRENQVIVKDLEAGAPLTGTPMLSGDQIYVGQRSWFSRSGGFLAVMIGMATAITVGLVIR